MKKLKETFDRYSNNLDYGNGFTGIYICQNY